MTRHSLRAHVQTISPSLNGEPIGTWHGGPKETLKPVSKKVAASEDRKRCGKRQVSANRDFERSWKEAGIYPKAEPETYGCGSYQNERENEHGGCKALNPYACRDEEQEEEARDAEGDGGKRHLLTGARPIVEGVELEAKRDPTSERDDWKDDGEAPGCEWCHLTFDMSGSL